jgi:hypothetical protein
VGRGGRFIFHPFLIIRNAFIQSEIELGKRREKIYINEEVKVPRYNLMVFIFQVVWWSPCLARYFQEVL